MIFYERIKSERSDLEWYQLISGWYHAVRRFLMVMVTGSLLTTPLASLLDHSLFARGNPPLEPR